MKTIIRTKKMIRYGGLLALVAALSGCGDDEGDDLDKFMRDAPKTMHAKVEPLPQIAPYTPIQFNQDAGLVDPFKGRSGKNTGSGIQPNLNRAKQSLENFAIENLSYVGMISKKGAMYALIKTPDNRVEQVNVGNYVGKNYGIITSITDKQIKVKELVKDEVSGDWMQRDASLNLQNEGINNEVK